MPSLRPASFRVRNWPLGARSVLERSLAPKVLILVAIILLILVGDTAARCVSDCVTATLVVGYRTFFAYLLFVVLMLIAPRALGRLYLSIVVVAMILLATALVELALRPLGMSQFVDRWLAVQSLTSTYVLIEVGIAIWWHHIIDPAIKDAPSDRAGEVAGTAGFQLGRKAVPIEDIDEIRAEGRFVAVVVRGAPFMLPMRFSDAVASIGPGYGMQVSRSLWLADRQFVACEQRGKTLVVVLCDGRVVPIGSTRRDRVLAWASAIATRQDSPGQT